MFFGKLKTYAIVAGAAILSALMIAVRILMRQNSKLRVRSKVSEAKAENALSVMLADKEIDEQADDHLVDVINEINETGTSAELDEPNEW